MNRVLRYPRTIGSGGIPRTWTSGWRYYRPRLEGWKGGGVVRCVRKVEEKRDENNQLTPVVLALSVIITAGPFSAGYEGLH